MFMLIGFSEKAGSGVNKIFMGWKNANWRPPFVEEQSHPDRVVLNLPMESLYPEEEIVLQLQLYLKLYLDRKLKEFHMINSRFWLFVTLKNKYLMKDFNIF